MFLEILTPQKKVYSGEVKLVKVPGSNGFFEILQNHAPIISVLEKGQLKLITKEDETQYFNVDNGVVQVTDNKVIVLVETLSGESL
jgi:F-type H+-transporting ATPase subunit epsilon